MLNIKNVCRKLHSCSQIVFLLIPIYVLCSVAPYMLCNIVTGVSHASLTLTSLRNVGLNGKHAIVCLLFE